VAATSGGVALDAERVTSGQLRDAEHDPIAAAVLLAEDAGAQKWGAPLRKLRHATLDEDAEARESAILELETAIAGEATSAEEVAARVRAFDARLQPHMSLPACAACGVRADPTDACDYKRHDISQLDILRYSAEQRQTLLAYPERFRRVFGFYALRSSGASSRSEGQDGASSGSGCDSDGRGSAAEEGGEDVLYHLRPELVEANGSVKLCGGCSTAVNGGRIPDMSLAVGVDYGVLQRVLPIVKDVPLSLAEVIAVSLNRLYMEVVKLKASGKARGAASLSGHAISFAHDAPQAVAAARPLLSQGVGQQLLVTLVAPQHLHDLLRRSGLSHPALRADPDRVFAVLEVLAAVNPRYAHVRQQELDTPAERAALSGLRLRAAVWAVFRTRRCQGKRRGTPCSTLLLRCSKLASSGSAVHGEAH